MHRRKILRSLLALIVGTAAEALAHPGGTDAQGCHVCSSSCSKYGLKNGERHCHAKKSGTKKKSTKPRKPKG